MGLHTWSVTLRLRIFKNRVLRKMFGPNWEEVTEGWKQQHDTELHDLYSSPNTDQIKEDEMDSACGPFEDERKCIQGLE